MICQPCKDQDHIECITGSRYQDAMVADPDADPVRVALEAGTWCDCQHQVPAPESLRETWPISIERARKQLLVPADEEWPPPPRGLWQGVVINIPG